MKRKGRFSEEQIITILKEREAGLPTVELCRKLASNVFKHRLSRRHL